MLDFRKSGAFLGIRNSFTGREFILERTFLESISCTAGYLEDSVIEFSRGLNCIIGARGTCKSTILESIRFASEADGAHTAVLRGDKGTGEGSPFQNLISETLGNAGTIRCVLSSEDRERSRFTVERELSSQPRIYIDDVLQRTDHSLPRLFEVYSQGDLQRVAESRGDRLKLIDNPIHHQVQPLKARKAELGHELRKVGLELHQIKEEVDVLTNELKDFDSLKSELTSAEANRPSASLELDESRRLYLLRQAVDSKCAEAVDHLSDSLGSFEEAVTSISLVRAKIREVDQLGLPHIRFVEVIEPIKELEDQTNELIAKCKALRLRTLLDQQRSDFESLDAEYSQVRRKTDELNQAFQREDNLRRQIQHLEERRAEHDGLLERRASLLSKREDLREELEQIRDKLYELRSVQVELINADHADVVVLRLRTGNESGEYGNLLESLLQGSRIRDQSGVAHDLAVRISPSQLVDIIEQSDADLLARLADRDLGQMARVLAHISDHDRLYDIEANEVDDSLDIAFFDNGVEKPIESLSKGQKATALLPLILRPSPLPLIIDQPEDDLDNSFIFRALVSSVRELKLERQLIFVTHNANIPVLGEADRVIVMSMKSATKADLPRVGTIDECKKQILDLLEGGAAAFEERHRRYMPLLTGFEMTE